MIKAISPVDGRYSEKTAELTGYFSEYALIRERVRVESQYFRALMKSELPGMPKMSQEQLTLLDQIISGFSEEDAEKVKRIEKQTNHDVKAVEYFIKEVFKDLGIGHAGEWIHFGLTSQDINNTAFPLLIRGALEDVLLPAMDQVRNTLNDLSKDWQAIPMLARTHGQPASPTLVGKEIRVFVERLNRQLEYLREYRFEAKFGGATGNFNAHIAAYPDYDWMGFADKFIAGFGLERQQTTTQIEHYDNLAALFHCLMRVNTILIDLSRDVWMYISMEYFGQKAVEHETGSSTMPHKVNPIDFENAEGNLGVANAILGHLAAKLPVSRLQRDLTDSTVLRNAGVPFAHLLIALKSLVKGLKKLTLNEHALKADLDKQWAVLSEAIQTILRREGVEQPYELLKSLTRGKDGISKEVLHAFIDRLPVDEKVKEEMKVLTPEGYTGYL